ncbi:endoribonuclease L-psp family protein [Auriculariales sp. MPI-PUGE-AT-0066]|nr:endoribonuclease L-psp family protein [Auriculariales sp. MPI-PUGE-AT-0066]
MAHLQYTNSPGFGQSLSDSTHYSQAVRIGDRIECAGIGGWDSQTGAIPATVEAEIGQIFSNIDLNIKTAGGQGWAAVYKVVLYYTGELEEAAFHAFVRNLRTWCPTHRPLLTGVGVASLGIPGMRFEVEVTAEVAKAQT